MHESQIKASYDALKQALDVLENAHEDYVDLVGDDVIKAEENYLKEPAKQMLEADVMYSQMMAREARRGQTGSQTGDRGDRGDRGISRGDRGDRGDRARRGPPSNPE